MKYPIEKIRSDFPILKKYVNNKRLVYLDSAASAQKPNFVINCEKEFCCNEYSSIHRGIHTLSIQASIHVEQIRSKIANFINASLTEEIIFVKGATEGINLVSNSLGKYYFNEGDNIIITEMEHHSNIVPWQMIAKEKKIILRFIPLLPNGTLDFSQLSYLIDHRTKLLAITHVSNVLGTINPLKTVITEIRKHKNIYVLIDGAQYVMHKNVDVQELDCDFYVFSGHKIYGPTGIGILYGKKKILNNMPPWEVGGGMIQDVNLLTGTTFVDAPWKFEAGSQNVTGIIGLNAAIDYINSIGLNAIEAYENKLIEYTMNSLKKVPELIMYGPDKKTGVIAFNMGKNHAYDIGNFLDQYGIAIRTGHHCAIPLMNYFKVTSMCRISLAMYTTYDEIDKLVEGLTKIYYLLNK